MQSQTKRTNVPAPARYWLIKSEPDVYSWDDLVRDGQTMWDGVRNFQARNNLRAMRVGDLAVYYHSNLGKEAVGLAQIVREAYPDPTTDDPNWVVVDVQPYQPLMRIVTLKTMKSEPPLASMGLIKQSQLSVVALTEEEFRCICVLGGI
jgi:predicted RNA-binding protein with PUA-like domain